MVPFPCGSKKNSSVGAGECRNESSVILKYQGWQNWAEVITQLLTDSFFFSRKSPSSTKIFPSYTRGVYNLIWEKCTHVYNSNMSVYICRCMYIHKYVYTYLRLTKAEYIKYNGRIMCYGCKEKINVYWGEHEYSRFLI